MQIDESDSRNNLVKFEKECVFEYLNDEVWPSGQLKSMVISTQNWNGEISLNFTPCFNCQNGNFSDKNIK